MKRRMFNGSLIGLFALGMLAGNAFAEEVALKGDVVVVGAGGAGMSAAVRAAERGAKVILLEKNPFIGGGAAFAEGLFGAETEWQRSKNYGFPVAEADKYIQRFHHFKANPKLNRKYLEESSSILNWLSRHDITFEAIQVSPAETLTWHVIGNYGKTNHGAAYIKALKDHADKLGVKTMLSTPAQKLIMKGGAVAGVRAKDAKGNTYVIDAPSVIIASGGFGDNPKLLKEFLGYDGSKVKASVPLNKTGDGILMAYEAGADSTSKTAVLHPGTEGEGIKFLDNIYVMTWQPANMWVNSQGERFAPETLGFEFSLAGNAIASQHGNYGWAVFDDAAIDYVADKGADVGIGVIIPTKTKLTELRKELEAAVAIKSSAVKKAASIEGLAKEMGVPAENLKQSLATYNKSVADKYDGEFFKESLWMRPIGSGSLYAVKIRPYFFATLGGLRTDLNMRVLDKNEKPIPGLFAAGVDVGGLYGDTYTTWTSGHAFGFAAWSGYQAATTATEK